MFICKNALGDIGVCGMHKRYVTIVQAEEKLVKIRRLLRKLAKIENSLDIVEQIDIQFEDE